MYDEETRASLVNEIRAGASLRAVSMRSGVTRATLRSWLDQPSRHWRSDCPFCSDAPFPATSDYLYLLGLYLGDGCISEAARTTALRIACADLWPGLMDGCEAALRRVSLREVYRVQREGCTEVMSLWKHWPCLLPQHGPGKKHNRPIQLTDWQCSIVEADPRQLIRGLIHSDGCRSINTIRHDLPSGLRAYSYPRYFFSNVSDDIRGIFTDALDLLGIEWKQNRWNSISVARREAVTALDEFVGPKY